MLSHPAPRPLPQPSSRPMGDGPARFVDAQRGADDNPGTQDAPWRTVTRGVERVPAGGTLYLRGGTYYEQVCIARAGRLDAPITLRSCPGEVAILDGGIREFAESPATAWTPVPGVPDLFRSSRAHPNCRYLLGRFADSMAGLLAYYHREDIAELDRTLLEYDASRPSPLPVYLGPGLWYDQADGHLYARLSHTRYNFATPGMENYSGVRDPREVPIVVAPYRAVPLLMDGARHVVVQDLAIRGGGENTVVMRGCEDVTFDNVLIYPGTYGLRARSCGQVKFLRSAIYGSHPPWGPHIIAALRIYSGNPPEVNRRMRELARLNTHVMLAIEGRTEDNVDYGWPSNREWEVGWCDFTDSLDGNHLGGFGVQYHHNHMDRVFDDSVYLTPLTPFAGGDIHVHSNLFTRCGIAFGIGGMSLPGGPVYVYRNVVDMRWRVPFSHHRMVHLPPFVRHGGYAPFGPLHIYQNTFISTMSPRSSDAITQDVDRNYGQSTLAFAEAGAPRRVFNNLFVHLKGMVPPSPDSLPRLSEDVQVDGNVHWDLRDPVKAQAALDAYRASDFFAQTRARYAPGWEANARAGDPQFARFSPDPAVENDYRIASGGAAAGAGVPLPKDLADPLRPTEGRPDAGAVPVGAPPLAAGKPKGGAA